MRLLALTAGLLVMAASAQAQQSLAAVNAAQVEAIYAQWATGFDLPTAQKAAGVRGVGFAPGTSALRPHAWISYFTDRPGSAQRSKAMPIGTPTPWDLAGSPDADLDFSSCSVRASYVGWFGYVGGVPRCPTDRQGEAACGLETAPIYEAALGRLYALDRRSLTSVDGLDGRPTREEVALATASCARAAVCQSNRLPGGLQASACSDPAACQITEGCYRDRHRPRGTVGFILDSVYGCGQLPACGVGEVSPPPPPPPPPPDPPVAAACPQSGEIDAWLAGVCASTGLSDPLRAACSARWLCSEEEQRQMVCELRKFARRAAPGGSCPSEGDSLAFLDEFCSRAVAGSCRSIGCAVRYAVPPARQVAALCAARVDIFVSGHRGGGQ